MLCENCHEQPATFHVVEITDGEKREVHLCEQCAHDKNVALPPSLSLNDILSSLMEAHADKHVPELANVLCPNCEMTYAKFQEGGRLGCPKDYAVFKKGLLPFIEHIHGSIQHKGKIPRGMGQDTTQASELLKLRRELNGAIASERYEEAAALRDAIRNLRGGQQDDGP
jgi:protein arginine kinase activator